MILEGLDTWNCKIQIFLLSPGASLHKPQHANWSTGLKALI